jgi:D-hydroxyproline dehydrogenase subunit beta
MILQPRRGSCRDFAPFIEVWALGGTAERSRCPRAPIHGRSNNPDHQLPERLLRSLTRTIETDVCVVGAGLIGLAHAHAARRRGLSVVVLERDGRAVGGSVRHAGHLFFSALPVGGTLDTAELARERWLELTRKAGAFVTEAGTLIVARHGDELAVMEAAAAEREHRAQMLTADQVTELAPVARNGVVGGFHGARDLRIDPRAVTAALARVLTRDPGARLEWGAHVHEVEPGVVHTDQLRVRAQAIVVCPGADDRALPPALSVGAEDRTLCRLQMLRLAAPTGRRYRPALATGLTLLRHPAFAVQSGAGELRARLELEKPELVERCAQLLVAQLPDGDLVVGETRTYGNVHVPFAAERGYRLLLAEAEALLGITPEVRQRWLGTEASLVEADPGVDFRVTAPLPGVRVVLSVSPLAMALCHVKASEVLSELLLEGAHSPTSGSENASVPKILVADRRRSVTGVRAHPEAFRARAVEA